MLVLIAVGRFPSTTGFVRDLCITTQKSLRSASVLRIIFKQRSELIPFLTYLTEFNCIFCILPHNIPQIQSLVRKILCVRYQLLRIRKLLGGSIPLPASISLSNGQSIAVLSSSFTWE